MKKSFGSIIRALRAKILKLKSAETQANERVIGSDQKYKCLQVSSQAHRKIQENITLRHQEYNLQVHQLLSLIKQTLTHTGPQLSPKRHLEIIKFCLEQTHLLSAGLISNTKKEPINLDVVLQEIQLLLSEKIYKANITLEWACSGNVIFYGDTLFIQLILANVIARAVHRISKNGKISITVTSQNKFIQFKLQDKGFPSKREAEEHVKRSFNFVIAEDVLRKMCQRADMSYTYSRNTDGYNVNEILIPTLPEVCTDSNVIPLFQ
ncbi:MAG: hypothetical protein BGO67_09860 [Alphaproteobacteria bacterium 41-28]|nr:MAG: hypothetical protein BGO67_09860 [Alphaproteobacteria bacterium 41-28]